jgi:hypothetical protein
VLLDAKSGRPTALATLCKKGGGPLPSTEYTRVLIQELRHGAMVMTLKNDDDDESSRKIPNFNNDLTNAVSCTSPFRTHGAPFIDEGALSNPAVMANRKGFMLVSAEVGSTDSQFLLLAPLKTDDDSVSKIAASDPLVHWIGRTATGAEFGSGTPDAVHFKTEIGRAHV